MALGEEKTLSNQEEHPLTLIDIFLPIAGILSIACLFFQACALMQQAETDFFPITQDNGADPARELFVFEEPYLPETFELLSMDPDTLLEPLQDPLGLEKPEPDLNLLVDLKSEKDHLRKGENPDAALKRHHIDRMTRHKVLEELKKAVDLRRCREGEQFELYFDSAGSFRSLVWHRGAFEVYEVRSDYLKPDVFVLAKKPVVLEKKIIKATGVISGGLIDSFSDFGLDPKLARKFSELFASRIDFNTEAHLGDSFSLIFEKYYKHDVAVGYGRILAARYCSQSGRCLEAYYFNGEGTSSGGYFSPEGKALGTSFLRSPLKVYRITSRFTSRRFHPILKVNRPHYGVDLAAPIGTPIMAVADGVVNFTGWQRGYGRIVIISHKGGYKTYYGHLSRFAKGIRKGVRVTRKQVIGYVGRSGYATGPHLDYRVKKNGHFVNPLKIHFPSAQDLPKGALGSYLAIVKRFHPLLTEPDTPKIISVETEKITTAPDGWTG